MGISDSYHFKWLTEAIAPARKQIRESLPTAPHVIGLGEQRPNAFMAELMSGIDFSYQACDLFPTNPETIPCDINDLTPLVGKMRADVVCLFRSSYFIRDKRKFFAELERVTNPGFWFFMDMLIGSSDLPVLDFRYGDRRASFSFDPERTAYFQTSFYDERLVQDFPVEVDAFVSHARHWPPKTKISYLLDEPRYFLRDAFALRQLSSSTLGHQMSVLLPETNLISLADFAQAGFEVVVFSAKYFYPEVEKFNLYCFVGARRKNA